MRRPFVPLGIATAGNEVRIEMGVVNPDIPAGSTGSGFTNQTGLDVVDFEVDQFRIQIGGTWEIPLRVYTDPLGALFVEGSAPTTASTNVAYLGNDANVEAFYNSKIPPFYI